VNEGQRLTKAAGWTAIALGGVHLVVVPIRTRQTWSQVWADGWWNTFTLRQSTTLAGAQRSETFWTTLGSFGAPMLTLGCHIAWASHHGQRVPGWLGWIVLAWGVPFATALPASPGPVIPIIGGTSHRWRQGDKGPKTIRLEQAGDVTAKRSHPASNTWLPGLSTGSLVSGRTSDNGVGAALPARVAGPPR